MMYVQGSLSIYYIKILRYMVPFTIKNKAVYLFVVMITLLSFTTQRSVEIKKEILDKVIQMKLNQTYELRYPQFDFNEIRQRFVSQIIQNSNKTVKFCTTAAPEITFEMIDKIYFDGIPPKPLLIYNFEDIAYEQMLLDAHFDNNEIHVFFQDGTVVYVQLDSDLNILKNTVFKANGLPYLQKISTGYFIKLQDKLLFVSGDFVFSVTNTEAIKLEGYKGSSMFQSVTAINSKYFATVSRFTLKLFRLSSDGDKLELVDEYFVEHRPTLAQKQAYTDIFYYIEKKAFLALDQYLGIVEFSIDFSSDSPKFGQKRTAIEQDGCYLFEINSMTKFLHVVCQRINTYNLQKWPIVKNEGSIVNPGIRVQQLYSIGPFTAFIGRDAFRVMYWNKFAAYYEDQNLDRLIFTPDLYISANEDSLMIGKYYLNDTYVKCKITDPAYLGEHDFLLSVKAECSQEYLDAHHIDENVLASIEQGDFCIYFTQARVHVWDEGSLMIQQMKIGAAIFLGVLIIGLGFVAYKKWDLHKAKSDYESFLSLNETKQKEDGKDEMQEAYESAQNINKEYELQQPPKNQINDKLQNQQPVGRPAKDLQQQEDKDQNQPKGEKKKQGQQGQADQKESEEQKEQKDEEFQIQ